MTFECYHSLIKIVNSIKGVDLDAIEFGVLSFLKVYNIEQIILWERN